MKPVETNECVVHAMVCTNERPVGKACCKKAGGQEFYQRMKEKIKADGLYNSHWVTRSGCLGFCNNVGTTVAIYPAGKDPVWFTEVTADDFDTIWNEVIKHR